MKYCPLCGAEFREAVDACATCGARLVSSLGAARVAGNVRRLLWAGADHREFDFIARGLRETEIPARLEAGAVGFFARLASSESRIHVLQPNFDRALEIAAQAAENRERDSALVQMCHACGANCSTGLAACPYCKAVLKVEHQKDVRVDVLREPVDRVVLKYCPLCDAEYAASHTHCTVCGVDLVPEELRGRPLDERQRKERIVVVWRGGDPVAVSEVINTLREAGIRHHVQPTNEHLVFELGMPRPKYAVRVFASDAAKAKELLVDIREAPPFALSETTEVEMESETAPRYRRHAWSRVAATAEIWTGEDSALAELLEACLYENEIGVRREGTGPGPLRLLVMPAGEISAREIIREIRDAAPPA
jgi:hypothetical protein